MRNYLHSGAVTWNDAASIDGRILARFGFSGKGNASDPAVLEDVLRAGAAGFKLHEDWGTTPAAIDCACIADEHDVQITIHTDTLNESGFVDGLSLQWQDERFTRTTRRVRAAGTLPISSRYAPESLYCTSSTNPTRPFTVNTIDEHLDMLMVCHHLDSSIPEDIAFAESRIRSETIAAEHFARHRCLVDYFFRLSGYGKSGRVVSRTWQTAGKMKSSLPEDAGNDDDNERIKRYVAKVTINPALAHGFSVRWICRSGKARRPLLVAPRACLASNPTWSSKVGRSLGQ